MKIKTGNVVSFRVNGIEHRVKAKALDKISIRRRNIWRVQTNEGSVYNVPESLLANHSF